MDTYLLYRFVKLFVPIREDRDRYKIPIFLAAMVIHVACPLIFQSALTISLLKTIFFVGIDFLVCRALFRGSMGDRVIFQTLMLMAVGMVDAFVMSLFHITTPGSWLHTALDMEVDDLGAWAAILAIRGVMALLVFAVWYIKGRPITKRVWQVVGVLAGVVILNVLDRFGPFWELGDPRVNAVIFNTSILMIVSAVMVLIVGAGLWGTRNREVKAQAEVRDRDHAIEIAQREREAVRGERHDMQNRLTPAIEMLAKGDAEGAYRHLLEIAGRLDDAASTIITGNLCVDGILNDKIQRGEDKGVRVAVTGQLDADLPVSPVDMGSLLGNALDNAIEACPAGGEVSVSFDCHGDMLVLEVRNPYRGKRKQGGAGRFTTTKLGDHGYGMNSMREVAARHNGSLIAWIEDEQFILNATLQIKAAMVLG